MQTSRIRKIAATLSLIAVGGALAVGGPVPGKWKVPDGGKKISQRPAGMNFCIITVYGPESVLVTSKGVNGSTSLVIQPDNQPHAFAVPANSKNCVIFDEVGGTGAGAKGFLLWAKQAMNGGENDPPSGTGQ